MRLSKPGIYQIVGDQIELLATVVGETPCLRIKEAIVMNTAFQEGKFEVVKEESIQIQNVYTNPDAYVFFPYGSEVCHLPIERQSMRGSKMPVITDDLYNEFIRRYKEDTSLPGRGVLGTKSYIMYRTNWTAAQAQLVICKIAREVKQDGYLRINK